MINNKTPAQAMLGTLHASCLSHEFPLCREAFHQVCNFKSHTQAHLTQASLVGVHELNDVILLHLRELVVLEQHTILGNLLDAQDLVTHGVQGQVQVVTATLQSVQVVTQFLRFHLIKLQVSDKDNTTFKLKTIWDAFTAQSAGL